MDSTTYSTMARLEKIAETLGVDLTKIEPLPVLSLESLEETEGEADETGTEVACRSAGQSPCICK